MDKRRLAKIKRVEAEFDEPFEEIIREFAKEHSYTFTMQALGLNKDTFKYLKPMFTPRKLPTQERPHVRERNLRNAPRHEGYTVSEMAVIVGVHRRTILQRLKLGWSVERILKTPNMNGKQGNVENFKGKRNKKLWADKISSECERAKDIKKGQ